MTGGKKSKSNKKPASSVASDDAPFLAPPAAASSAAAVRAEPSVFLLTPPRLLTRSSHHLLHFFQMAIIIWHGCHSSPVSTFSDDIPSVPFYCGSGEVSVRRSSASVFPDRGEALSLSKKISLKHFQV